MVQAPLPALCVHGSVFQGWALLLQLCNGHRHAQGKL
jgi:hypothetical protein